MGKSDLRIRRGGFGGRLAGRGEGEGFEGEGAPSFAVNDVQNGLLGDFPVGGESFEGLGI